MPCTATRTSSRAARDDAGTGDRGDRQRRIARRGRAAGPRGAGTGIRPGPRASVTVLAGRVEPAVGDIGDPASIRAALAGVERVFLCTPNHPQQVEHETNVIDAATVAGIRRLVKIGANGAQIGSPVAFWDAHGRIEAHPRQSGVPAVVLHPSSYTSNLLA